LTRSSASTTTRRRTAVLGALAVLGLAVLGLALTGCFTGAERAGAVRTEALSPAMRPTESLHEDPPATSFERLTEAEPPPPPEAQGLTQQLASTMETAPAADNFASGECHGDQDIHIHLQGADGNPVTAQISADFKRGGVKVGEDGQPIPSDQYSRLLYVNGADGSKDTCLANVPDAEVFVEVYPKNYLDGSFVPSTGHYGSVMWHGVWPGPGQAITLTMPLACDAGDGQHGRTGAITFSAQVDGKSASLSRLVAWSRADGSSRLTPGFAVADSAQEHSDDVARLDRLAPDQPYFVQVQTTDGQIMSFEPVPVSSCKDTEVALTKSADSCVVQINGGDGHPCTLLKQSVG
jgi:hypothetical protein